MISRMGKIKEDIVGLMIYLGIVSVIYNISSLTFKPLDESAAEITHKTTCLK
jgi:hypothetical protein